MSQLKKISLGSKIKRKDLSKSVSIETYHDLITHLKCKIEKNQELATHEMQALGSTWDEIQMAIFNDPSQYLMQLLQLSDENVGEIEAKWRALLSNILDQDTHEIEGRLFNLQEEVFIKTLIGIQHCEGGKNAGIASSYELLDPKYRYSIKLSSETSVERIYKEMEKNNAINFFKEFIKSEPTYSSKESLVKALTNYVNSSSGKNIKFAHSLLEDSYELVDGSLSGYLYFDESEESTLPILNRKGCLKILDLIDQEKAKEDCLNLTNLVVQKTISSQFTGTNALMQQLTGVKYIEEGAHQSIYIKNLIGHLVGISQEVFFDLYTGWLYDSLINKSRDEVLEIFFTHVTPKVIVNELIKFINQEPVETRKSIKTYLSNDSLWTNEDQINRKGALKLLSSFEFISV